eukprot:CAMPEP_0117074816 /NCGR_PEP_ID=MMETSP0472-20121206/52725_1 /TAXON_ID=693140 ORGANISM="Tiarina fusus, Strain LIS" /NCGR_SAMPLE_ID=MMETSP0472 /ASSEMBLY_ACC=CAM_ASM_000603 /LENGTH=49 /DNA_ID= /DNA_START= /DNA_END= /DNA_ORIENTATION=
MPVVRASWILGSGSLQWRGLSALSSPRKAGFEWGTWPGKVGGSPTQDLG